VLDTYLQADKQFVDIGAWIGPLVFYAASRASRVISVEADAVALKCLTYAQELNNASNVLIVPAALVGSGCGPDISFGPNSVLTGAVLGDSTSQVGGLGAGRVPTITLEALDELVGGINSANTAIIKIDIEGGEEEILGALLELCAVRGVPLYISFHLTWWKRLSVHDAMTLCKKHFPITECELLLRDPFCSILFKP
jgi:FkbM family methyltransferase